MEHQLILTSILKWVLISLTGFSTSSLVWRILKRKSLHTVFNLGWCFYFLIAGSVFPFMINEYISLLQEMILDPISPRPHRCQALYWSRVVAIQVSKVLFLNLCFRYVIIKFSHYSQGLSNSFSRAGIKDWMLSFTYFTSLFGLASAATINMVFKSSNVSKMEHIVKGRICLLLRFVFSIFSDGGGREEIVDQTPFFVS